jgi:hypothetical protein
MLVGPVSNAGHYNYRLLCSVAGIGPIPATVILLETGDIRRFADVGNYVFYCRCVGSTHVSNGKKTGEGNTKNGNRFLAWAYVGQQTSRYVIAKKSANFTNVKKPRGTA